jgi:glycosyltransferase involved in cell wall biosynthesis
MKITVVLLTWQRLTFLKRTLMSLSQQSYKDFDVYISNGNLGLSDSVNKYAEMFSDKLNIKVAHDGNDIKTFRRFTTGNVLARSGTDVVLFIDDDVIFSHNYIEQMLNSYVPKTYQSGFAWTFQENGKDYYRYRTKVKNNNSKIHYCGTGVSMVDAKIFLDQRLFAAPKEAYFIEDIWLSYFAQQVLGWDLVYVNLEGVHIGGGDQHALYKKIMKDKKINNTPDKADFLRMLVQKYGWKL